jgi:hypothetical protein
METTDSFAAFENWMCKHYGTSAINGRPSWSGMRMFHADLTRTLRAAGQEPYASPKAIYAWYATTREAVRSAPELATRAAIERMSGGQVKASGWGR